MQKDRYTDDWQKDRTLTPRQFKLVIKRLGLSQAAAGRYLGFSARTARRFASGEKVVPASAVLLLQALLNYGVKPVVPKWERSQN